MKLVQKGNKQLRVEDSRVEEMLEAGYVEVDSETGRPLRPAPAAKDARALKKENDALRKENSELRAQIADLTAKDKP